LKWNVFSFFGFSFSPNKMHQAKPLATVSLLACAVTVVEAFALLSRPIGLRSFRNVGVQMAAPTQDKMQITPARISDIANDLKSRHTPAIAKEIDALFAPLMRELPPTQVKLGASFPSDLPGGALLRIGPNPRAGRCVIVDVINTPPLSPHVHMFHWMNHLLCMYVP